MKLLFDFFPIVFFFVTYRWFGIYAATVVAMIASGVQVMSYYIKHQRLEAMHWISFVLIVLLGGATLFFHNPWYIKWKPTGIYWVMACVIAGSQWIGDKTVVQRMMEKHIVLPIHVWLRLNSAWAFYFMLLGSLNLYIAYYFSTDAWVNFKLFGGAGLTFAFVFLQAFYLTRYARS